jgi:hypothetical protein
MVAFKQSQAAQFGNIGCESDRSEQGYDFSPQTAGRKLFFLHSAAENLPYFISQNAPTPPC